MHAPGFGLDIGGEPGPTPPQTADLGSVGGVQLRETAAEWAGMLAGIERLDRETLAQAGQLLAMIHDQEMSAEQFAAWAREHEITPNVLTVGLLMVGVHRQDNYPTPQADALVLASGLEALAGERLSQVQEVPPFGRLWLAILLGGRGDSEGALTAFDSMTDEQLVALPHETTVMAVAHLMDDAPRAAVGAIVRYGTATDQQPQWCWDLEIACQRLSDPQVTRDVFIPWAERGLETPGSETLWDPILPGLIRGYEQLDQPERALERGLYWLAQAGPRGVNPATLLNTRLKVASLLARVGRIQEAATAYRPLIECENEAVSGRATRALVWLAKEHPEVKPPESETLAIKSVWP